MRGRLLTLAAGATAAVALAPGVARADVQCSASNGVVDVTITAGGSTYASVARQSGAQAFILVNGKTCDQATLTSTNKIVVTDVSGGVAKAALDESAGMLAKPSGQEIPFSFDGKDGTDELIVFGVAGPDRIRVGELGINLDYDEASPDVDVTSTGVEAFDIRGSSGDDKLSAIGGAGTGGPYHGAVYLSGGSGQDSLQGAGGDDILDGGPDQDSLFGGEGDDDLIGGSGPDTLIGSGGDDSAEYLADANGSTGVTVDLSNPLPQDTGPAGVDTLLGIEGVTGSAGDDVLTGTDGPNYMSGLGGNDRIDGGKGIDTLNGGSGQDTVLARDGEGDTVNCGMDADTVTGDAGDVLYECETVDLIQGSGPGGGVPGGGGPGGGVPGGAPGGDGGAAAGGGGPLPPRGGDASAPTLKVALAGRQRLATVRTRGLRLRVTCSSACTLSGLLRSSSGARLGRLAGRPLAAGVATTVALRLDARAQRALRHRRHATLTAVLTGRDALGHQAEQRVRVKL